MSVANTLTQLRMLHRVMDVFKTIPDRYPGSLNTADLPVPIFWPGRAIIRPVTSRAAIIRVERRYDIRVFMEPLGQNDYNVPVTNAVTLLDTCLGFYWEHKILADGVTEIVQVEDSGIISGGDLVAVAPLVYGAQAYRGFVCALTILEHLQP